MGRRLLGKKALVIGGGRGLGREIALAYAEEGADVAVAARTLAEIESVAKQIRNLSRSALAISADVCREEQVNHMVRRVVEEFGTIDILVNDAGGSGQWFGPLWEQTVEQWQHILDVNLTGTFRCIRAVIPQMVKQKGGVVVNISSWTAQPGEKPVGFGAYAVAKTGIEGLTQLLAAEVARFNIRVNTIRPGGPCATGNEEWTEERVDSVNWNNKHAPLLLPDIIRPVAVFIANDQAAGVSGESFEAKKWNLEHGFGAASKYVFVLAKK